MGARKGWRKSWTLTGAELEIATHTNGLVVRFDAGGRSHVDAATLPAAEAAIMATGVAIQHAGAEIYRMVADATRFRAERLAARAIETAKQD